MITLLIISLIIFIGFIWFALQIGRELDRQIEKRNSRYALTTII